MDSSQQYKNEFERLISLSGLTCRLLLRWKSIILVALIAFLFGAFLKYRESNTNNETVKVDETIVYSDYVVDDVDFEDLQNSLTNSYRQEDEIIKKNILMKHDYFANSVIANTSPYNVPVAQCTYYIDAPYKNIPDNATEAWVVANNKEISVIQMSLLDTMKNFGTSGIDWESIAKEYGVKNGSYVSEIAVFNISEEYNTLTINVYFKDKESSMELLNRISELTEIKFTEIIEKQQLNGYHLIKLDSGVSETVMPEWFSWHNTVSTQIGNLESTNAITSARANTNKKITLGENSDNKSTQISKKTLVKSGLKYAILFDGLYVASLIGYLLLSNKVLSGNEFDANYKLNRITSFNGENFAKRDLISKELMRFIDKRTLNDLESALPWICEELSISVHKPKKIGLVSDVDNKEIETISYTINSINGIKCVKLIGINRDYTQLEELKKCDSVILFSVNEETNYTDIKDSLDLINKNSLNILGSININN